MGLSARLKEKPSVPPPPSKFLSSTGDVPFAPLAALFALRHLRHLCHLRHLRHLRPAPSGPCTARAPRQLSQHFPSSLPAATWLHGPSLRRPAKDLRKPPDRFPSFRLLLLRPRRATKLGLFFDFVEPASNPAPGRFCWKTTQQTHL